MAPNDKEQVFSKISKAVFMEKADVFLPISLPNRICLNTDFDLF